MAKTFFGKIFAAIGKFFSKLSPKIKKVVEISSKVIDAIKTIETDPGVNIIEEIIKRAIPGETDDKIINKVRQVVTEWIPKMVFELSFVEQVNETADVNEKLRLILSRWQVGSDETKKIAWQGLATLVLDKMADGELTWEESRQAIEYYYKNILNAEVK